MIIKSYQLSKLCDNLDSINWRIKTIEEITKYTLSPVLFVKTDKELVRTSTRVKILPIQYGKLSCKQNIQLSEYLDFIHNNKLVHGDINKKNLFIDQNNNIILLDWEPSLTQIINNKFSLMGTPPWIDLQDLTQKKLTIKTDLLCFYKVISNSSSDFFKSIKWFDLLKISLSQSNPFAFLLSHYYYLTNKEFSHD